MGRYDLILYKLVNIYGIFLRGHLSENLKSCSPRQKFLVTPLIIYELILTEQNRKKYKTKSWLDPSKCLWCLYGSR